MAQTDAPANDILYLHPNFGINSELQIPSSLDANNKPLRCGTD